MKFPKAKIQKMIAQLDTVCKNAIKLEQRYSKELAHVYPTFRKSALNLLHYLALRHEDIQDLQNRLGQLGVSRLGQAESHVLTSLLAVRSILSRSIRQKKSKSGKAVVTFKQGAKLIRTNTNALLGKKLKGSKVRIMVTLPTEAAHNKKLVHALLAAGMNCARINCAHDDPEIWKMMIDNLKWAKRKTGRNCKICMDLAGPKLRTGAMKPGPKVVHLQPKRDSLGRVVSPMQLWLAPPNSSPPADVAQLFPVSADWLSEVSKGDKIHFTDTREKRRSLEIEDVKGTFRLANCYDSAYVISGMELMRNGDNSQATCIGELPSLEQRINLKFGDTLILHRDSSPGEPAEYDAEGNLTKAAHISCTLPEIFSDVKPGEPILFNDGKIEGCIRSVSQDELAVEITYAKEEGAKLRADKGINLPESKLRLSGLTDKDRADLKFVAQYADVVNMSFVNGPHDVFDLLEEIKKLKASHLGIILKIETQRGFRNLPGILLAAMQTHPVGVMIARGDLAIEGGWQHLAELQEEILRLCEAAHLPIVWATQVLETLAKKGRPSRAEISDAAMAQQAECVMLNKGPHIIDTIKMLDDILKRMGEYHQKKAPMLPVLKSFEYLNLD